jgi:hypothetical protein
LNGDRLSNSPRRLNWLAILADVFASGFIISGYLFSDSQERSFLAVHECRDRCLQPNELAGLIASAGVLKADELLPGVEMESQKR